MAYERAQAILRAAIEAGAVMHNAITVVIVADGSADIHIASSGPNEEAVEALTIKTLLLALLELQDTRVSLTAKIEVAKGS